MPRKPAKPTTPKSPPKPGSVESIRSQAAGLERLAAIAADFQEPKATDVADEAARALLVTPAFRDDMLWRKWEVLEEFVSADATDGGATDNRAVMALGCIKADLIRLGIGHEGDAQ
jgi:hypothetical protein